MNLNTRWRKPIAAALLAVGLCTHALAVEVTDHPLAAPADLNGECFQDLSTLPGISHDTYKQSFAERAGGYRYQLVEHPHGLALAQLHKLHEYGEIRLGHGWHYGADPSHAFGYQGDGSNYCEPVPEPQTIALMLIGLGGLAVVVRRKGRLAAAVALQTGA